MENYTDAPKKPSIAKKIAFGIVALILALIYSVVFIRSYQTRDTAESKIVYFSQRARDLSSGSAGFEVYKLSPSSYISKDGMVSMRSVNYLYTSDELQLTVKYKKDILKNPDDLYPYLFTLTDESGTIFEQYYTSSHEQGNYCYVRLCFTQIKFDFEKKTPIYLSVYDPASASEPIYKLTLYDRGTGADKIGKYDRKDI